MSLKQECIDMINLIVRSSYNEDDNYYELGTNVKRQEKILLTRAVMGVSVMTRIVSIRLT